MDADKGNLVVRVTYKTILKIVYSDSEIGECKNGDI